MKRFSCNLILSLFAAALTAEAQETTLVDTDTPPAEQVRAHKNPTAQRQLEMELEEIEGATGYEIELRSVATGKVSTFKMAKPLWRAKVRPGKYKMRLRSYDDRGVAGEWADPQEFIVAFPPPRLLKPAQNEAVKTGVEEKAEIEFSWEPVSGAGKYRLDVALSVGDTEDLRHPAGYGNDEGKKSGETSAEGSLPGETFSEIVEGTSATITLPVARTYSWKVTALMPTGEDGEPTEEPGKFIALGKRLDTPEIERPMDRYVQSLTWDKPARTEMYSYALSRLDPKTKTWRTVDKKSGVPESQVNLAHNEPGGKYRLQVRGEAKNCEPSNIAKIEFDVFNGNRSPAAVEQARLRDSMEKPTTWYAIASYLITNVTYESINADGGVGAHNVAYANTGGTGRVGLGYFKPNKPSGYIGILDLSGLNVAGENVTFASLEAHYARRYYWGVNQFRVSGGLFYKQLPQSELVSTASNKYKHQKVSYMGPHVGADFWHPFSYKYGMQVNTRLYLAAFTGSTPNGNDVEVTPSFQFGLMGSMRLSHNMIGFAGWAHRTDRIVYGKGANSTATVNNEINLTGNYLNLLLEYGF